MPFLDYVLAKPTYGWEDEKGELVRPSPSQLLAEFFRRLNIFRDRRNWLSFMSWSKVLLLSACFILFLFEYLNWQNLLAAFLYGMVIMGTHGTVWHHWYCTHSAYRFRNKFWRLVTQNLTINVIPEEIYVVSHHVHHAKSDQTGDPYNAEAGFLYCFLADVNHQPIARNLSHACYKQVSKLMQHTGVKGNSYEQYQRWGSYAHPLRTFTAWILNWSFWFIIFYLLGGTSLAITLFGAAGFWAVGVRTFNYEGHGKGKNNQRQGVDFNRNDRSINQLWPGIVAGEWHNNHHLFPNSARSGFKPEQVDLTWYFIKLMYLMGAVSYYRDNKEQFYKLYYQPYKEAERK